MEKKHYTREIVSQIKNNLASRDKPLINVLCGPRQVGKTTAARSIEARWHGRVVFANADGPLPPGPDWILHHWDQAAAVENGLLIIDEIQKINGWSEVIKSLWDDYSVKPFCPTVLLLGSSSLLIQKGLSESLAGRFFLYRFPHWTYREMAAAFAFSLDQWIFYGGYPGAAPFIKDADHWASYVRDSLIETVLAKDVLQLQNIAKPALLRHLFMMSASFPAEILSYTKMLGQLQDAGNTTTLSHYMTLLEAAYMVTGLELYRKGAKVKRGSSPKLVLWNNALVNAVTGIAYEKARNDGSQWGRLVENAVGGHLLNSSAGLPWRIFYWRTGTDEVDFVVETPLATWAIEVKSGKAKKGNGLEKFRSLFPGTKTLLLGHGGMPLEEFFGSNPKDILG